MRYPAIDSAATTAPATMLFQAPKAKNHSSEPAAHNSSGATMMVSGANRYIETSTTRPASPEPVRSAK